MDRADPGTRAKPGAPVSVTFDPRVAPPAWTARWAPITAAGAGDVARHPRARTRSRSRVPDQAGAWSLQLEARFGQSTMRPGTGASTSRWPRAAGHGTGAARGAGRGRCGTAGRRPAPAQASAPAAVALKIEAWASSGSITPKIFCSVRRWTQEPQLSK